jgi:nicotinamidase-related amidase
MNTAASMPSSLCQVDDSILLVIDVQTKLTAVMPPKVLARLQRNTGLLLQSAARLGVPVFASEQYPQGLGSLEADIQKLLPADTRRYEKTVFSLAAVPEFSKDLEASGRRQVVIAGMEAHVCVLQTAIELHNAGYRPFVVADAVCSRHRESYETALERLRQAGVIVSDAESVLFEWLRDSRSENFKALQQLIR